MLFRFLTSATIMFQQVLLLLFCFFSHPKQKLHLMVDLTASPRHHDFVALCIYSIRFLQDLVGVHKFFTLVLIWLKLLLESLFKPIHEVEAWVIFLLFTNLVLSSLLHILNFNSTLVFGSTL